MFISVSRLLFKSCSVGGIPIFFSGFFSLLLHVVFLIFDLKIYIFYKFISQSSVITGVLCQLWGDKIESQWTTLWITKNVTTSQCTLYCETARNQVALSQFPDETIQQLDVKAGPQINDNFFPIYFRHFPKFTQQYIIKESSSWGLP